MKKVFGTVLTVSALTLSFNAMAQQPPEMPAAAERPLLQAIPSDTNEIKTMEAPATLNNVPNSGTAQIPSGTMSTQKPEEVKEESADEKADKIFGVIDLNGDGNVTRTEFREFNRRMNEKRAEHDKKIMETTPEEAAAPTPMSAQ